MADPSDLPRGSLTRAARARTCYHLPPHPPPTDIVPKRVAELQRGVSAKQACEHAPCCDGVCTQQRGQQCANSGKAAEEKAATKANAFFQPVRRFHHEFSAAIESVRTYVIAISLSSVSGRRLPALPSLISRQLQRGYSDVCQLFSGSSSWHACEAPVMVELEAITSRGSRADMSQLRCATRLAGTVVLRNIGKNCPQHGLNPPLE
jgi:hypothetical protein